MEKNEEIQREYERIREVFDGSDEKKIKLADGLIRQAAETSIEIQTIREQVRAAGGRIQVNPKNPKQQRILPAARELDKMVPTYTAMITRLCSILDKSGTEEEDDTLNEFE